MKRLWLLLRKFYRTHFLGVELFITLSLIIIGVILTSKSIGFEVVENSLHGSRSTLYGSLASIAGAMLGFVITGLSILLTTNTNARMERLKKSKHYKTVFIIFFSTSKYLGLLLIASLISLIFDKDSKPMIPLTIISFSLSLIVGVRLLRCIWVLEKIVKIHILK